MGDVDQSHTAGGGGVRAATSGASNRTGLDIA